MISIAATSNLLGAVLFLILTVLLFINWKGQLIGGLLILASSLSAVWFFCIAYNASSGDIPLIWIKVFETLRDGAWLTLLYAILSQRPASGSSSRFKVFIPFAIVSLCGSILIITIFVSQVGTLNITSWGRVNVNYMCYLFIALLGLLLVEKTYRSTLPDARWAVKFLCFGIGGIFAYDFFLYSEALLFDRISPEIWFVRGAINAICVPLLAVAVARNPQWNMDLFVSRHVVYQSTVTSVAGLYLILMAVAGYYIKNYGGTWGGALQIVFVFGSLMFLLVLAFSEEMRVKLKVYLAEHFYKNKYDYRQEWLSITETLAENNHDNDIYKPIIRAVTNTMKCPGGALWLADDYSVFRKIESISFHDRIPDEITLSPALEKAIVSGQSIINIDNITDDSIGSKTVALPDPLLNGNDIWLFMALVNNETIMGFVLLTHPHTQISFSAEDKDLLKNVGNQIASYIALLKVTENLAEARQFEVFNRLSAFVVHDIKNLVAQLSLIKTNAVKFRKEPEFIDDVFSTIENVVEKMKRMLTTLEKGEIVGTKTRQSVNINELIQNVISIRSLENPVPQANLSEEQISLLLDIDKFQSVLEHLVQNAQQATEDTGHVSVSTELGNDELKIAISDNGVGMDADFVRNYLFKPFFTTKGNAGMGIGAYESREIVHELGGKLLIDSTPGIGTTMTISLPLSKSLEEPVNQN